METTALGGTTNAASRQAATTRGFNDLSGKDFVALLIAELQAQDPLKPADNKEIVAQMANLRQMEQSEKLNETLKVLASEQRFGSTAGLIGHYVAGRVTDGSGREYEIQGLVIGVRYENGRAILQLHNGLELPAEKVEQVTMVENLPPEEGARLQQELEARGDGGAPAGNGGALANGDGAAPASAKALTPAAHPLRREAAARPVNASGVIRGFGRQVNETASLLESLFAPRASVGI